MYFILLVLTVELKNDKQVWNNLNMTHIIYNLNKLEHHFCPYASISCKNRMRWVSESSLAI